MLRLLVVLVLCLAVSSQDASFAAPTNPLQPVAQLPDTVNFDSQPPAVPSAVQTPPTEVDTPLLPPTVQTTPPAEIKTPPPKKPTPPQDAVWLCDQSGARRGTAGSAEAERLIAQGIKLADCQTRGPRLPPPVGSGNMCDANGRPRGRASSPYVQSLVRQGVQLQPCAGPATNVPIFGGRLGGRIGNRILPNNAANNAGMMCDANGRPRGRSSSAYVQALVRQGLQLQPCAGSANAANTNANANNIVNRVGNRILPNNAANNAGMMCDANGRPRGRSSSAYVQALVRQGMQLAPCLPARATDPGSESTTTTSASSTPSWAIALIVVGSILIVVLLVLAVRLTQILKSI